MTTAPAGTTTICRTPLFTIRAWPFIPGTNRGFTPGGFAICAQTEPRLDAPSSISPFDSMVAVSGSFG